MKSKYGLPTLALLALSLCLSCGKSSLEPPFNIYLIVLDACRADKIGCYGSGRETSPSIDALARDPDSVVFRRHYVQGSWTKPSMASLFSGLHCRQHRLFIDIEKQKEASFPRSVLTQSLSDEIDTMAERLREAGFETFAVLSNPHLDPRYRFDQGFVHYRWLPGKKSNDRKRVQTFLEMSRQSREGHFAYLHLTGCHCPRCEKSRSRRW